MSLISLATHPVGEEWDRAGTVIYTTDATGETIFTLRLVPSLVLEIGEEPRVELAKTLCRHTIATNKSTIFRLDVDIDETSGAIVDFYMLNRAIGVMCFYSPSTWQWMQVLVALNEDRKIAETILIRRQKLRRMQRGVSVALGLLHEGRILVSGLSSPEDGSVMHAVLLAADPRLSFDYPDVELDKEFAAFSKALGDGFDMAVKLSAGHPSQLSIWPETVCVDKRGVYFMLTQKKSGFDVWRSGLLGEIAFGGEKARLRLAPVDDTAITKGKFAVLSNNLRACVHRKQTAWLTFLVPDYGAMRQWGWSAYGYLLVILLRILDVWLRCVLWVRRWDGGLGLRIMMRVLQGLFGPSLLPPLGPPPKLIIYAMDTHKKKIYQSGYEVSCGVLRRGSIPVVDCDSSGAALICQLPDKDDKNHALRVSLALPPGDPQTLHRLASLALNRHKLKL